MPERITNDWRILKSARKSDYAIIVGITLIFMFVVAMNVNLIFQMTSDQTEEVGKMQLEKIRGDLQGTLSTAENMTMRVAIGAEQMLASGASVESLMEFFYQQKKEQSTLSNGDCFNVYMANRDITIIPDFEMPEDYHAVERLWYKGAESNPERVYITEPYIDAATGDMCFTMSTLLSDGQTVVGLDFNLSNTQESISRMISGKNRTGVIVTRTGMIIGYQNSSYVGEKISKKLPEYVGILERVISTKNHDSFLVDLYGQSNTIFSSETSNGWYMILCVDTSELYRDNYRQMAMNTSISLLMLIAIIFFYLSGVRNRLHAEQALHVQEEFLSRLSKDLRDPLVRILKLTDLGALEDDVNPAESAAQVRESALQLSDMLDNLFSFSRIITANATHPNQRRQDDIRLSKISRIARTGIVAVLISAMGISLVICLDTTTDLGDAKMYREADEYEYQVSNWITKQQSILSMFVNSIAERPELMEDYPSAVKWLNDIAQNYPEISVCYMANPYREHTVIMNNGWQPDSSWHVEQRQWYIDTERSENAFSVSAPYYDEQTGTYCVTLSQIVYGRNGEFLGIFGIDFFADRLINVLGESYTKNGYAFLVDRNGIIINHPNPEYQMSMNRMTDIAGTEYQRVFTSNDVVTLKDYSDTYVACVSKKNATSNFTIIVANRWWNNVYGNIIIIGILFILLFAICITAVVVLINRLLRWQNEVQKKLTEAADQAVAAGKAKSQFLAQMSHEIRTPINAVLGMNEMIVRESHDDEILDYAENIQSAGKTLLNLINNILDFSKIEDGKMEIIPIRYEVPNLITDLINMISEKAKKKNLKLITRIDPNLPRSLYGDDVRIRQVITNILTNAVKYTQEGSVTLSMSGRQIDSDTLELLVVVKDTGIGIREEDMDKLFQSFQRLDEEKNRNIEGTGLGISIVQKLLSMMDSHLEVESVYGEGSTFSFKLQQKIIDKTPIGDRSEKDSVSRKKSAKYLRAPDAKILVVDDNEMNLKVIKGLLKRSGIKPDLVTSGRECLDRVKENQYDIIFLDHMMPEMDGVETLKRLKSGGNLPDSTTVIVLTANAITGAREMYIKEGFQDYLTKPIEIDLLEQMIARYLPEGMATFEDPNKPAEVVKEKSKAEEVFNEQELNRFKTICPEIDLNAGLSNCMEDRDFLFEMMQEFLSNDKNSELDKLFESKDLKNYQIQTHALKSTAQVIGAVEVSEIAKSLEMLAKDRKFDESKHHDLLKKYRELLHHLKLIFGIEEESVDQVEDQIEKCPGIDFEVGLSNCMNDRDSLREKMKEFVANDKTSELEKLFESKDLKNYQIQTHALKSTAQVIGAIEVSEIAKSLELLAKDQKFDESKHHELLKKYRELLHHLKLIFGIEEESVDQVEDQIEKCPGIDFEVGLSNCMNDRDSLREKMKEFVANDKTSELEKLFESKDLKNYQIQTHALKSTAQVIGAIEVSEIAKSLEMLAKDQKFDESKHHDLLKKYRELLHQLKLIFGIEEESVEDQVEEQIEKCPGIDFEVGLSNCMEDPEFLREMMEEFIANDKTSELDKLFESKDLKNYQIQTHALKSTSQVIGAIELSEISKSLELNAKNQILDETKHSEMIDAYRKLLANLKKYLEADARA